MRRFSPGLMLAAMVLAGALGATPAHAVGPATTQPRMYTSSDVALHAALRKLWEDHVTYTRTFIISALAGLPDTDSTAGRLLRNQDDLGAAIVPFYGEAAGTKLASLLRDHILIAAGIVKAAKTGDTNGVNTGETAWHANAMEIAAFLGSANPNWSRDALGEMLDMHLAFTTTEVVSRIDGDWTADQKAYDEGHEHMLKFSDMLADGIVKQFPARFKG
jgi:hypothetical protein